MQYYFRHWQTGVFSLLTKGYRQVFTLHSFILSKFSFKLLSKIFLRIALLALPLLSYSWQLHAANDNNNQTGGSSDAILISDLKVINYVEPCLSVGSRDYAGPRNIWSSKKGFLVQSINPLFYALNFPTTGADGLFFDFSLVGNETEGLEGLIWAPVMHEGITVTVVNTNKSCENNKCDVKFRVTLQGPEARTQWNNNNPSRIQVPKLPQTFELVGKDNIGNEVVKYGFVLQKWFVNRGPNKYTYNSIKTWCNDIGYKTPQIKDLTNGRCRSRNNIICPSDAVADASLLAPYQDYQRRIGGGLFAEWGFMDAYRTTSDFVINDYWATEGNFLVRSGAGNVWTNTGFIAVSRANGVCVTSFDNNP